MSPRFVLGRENLPCVAEVVNRSLKADCTDFNNKSLDFHKIEHYSYMRDGERSILGTFELNKMANNRHFRFSL